MKIIGILAALLVLSGCNTTTDAVAPAFDSAVIEVSVDDLDQYWVSQPVKPKMLKGRPSWLPKGEGSWTVMTVIDSTGKEVEKTLIDAQPKGFMTQSMVDEMPKTVYSPAASNQTRVPVKFYGTARVAPRSKL